MNSINALVSITQLPIGVFHHDPYLLSNVLTAFSFTSEGNNSCAASHSRLFLSAAPLVAPLLPMGRTGGKSERDTFGRVVTIFLLGVIGDRLVQIIFILPNSDFPKYLQRKNRIKRVWQHKHPGCFLAVGLGDRCCVNGRLTDLACSILIGQRRGTQFHRAESTPLKILIYISQFSFG